jgi:hypothetical protein
MLFGRSVFQSILTRLDEENPGVEPEAEPAFRVKGLNAGFVVDISLSEANSRDTARAYQDFSAEGFTPEQQDPVPEEQAEPPTVVMPAHLSRLSEQEIAEDLGLLAQDNLETLAEKRRRFAMDNHPDRLPAEFRLQATTRMTIANMLVDQAIRMYPLR